MKHVLLFLLLTVFLAGIGFAQDKNSLLYDQQGRLKADTSFSIPPEQVKAFAKIEQGLLNCLMEQIKYPPMAADVRIQGLVVVSFTADEKGLFNDYRIERGIGGGTEESLIKTIENCAAIARRLKSTKGEKVVWYIPADFKRCPEPDINERVVVYPIKSPPALRLQGNLNDTFPKIVTEDIYGLINDRKLKNKDDTVNNKFYLFENSSVWPRITEHILKDFCLYLTEEDVKFIIHQFNHPVQEKWDQRLLKHATVLTEEKRKKIRQERDYTTGYSFGAPLFSIDKKYAVTNVFYHCGGNLCGEGCTFLYKKTEDGWKVAATTFCVIS